MGENLKSLFLRINFHQNIPILKSEKVQIKKSYKAIFLEEVKFTGKRLCQSLVFHRCFLVNFAKFPKTLFYRTSHGPKPTNLNLNNIIFVIIIKLFFQSMLRRRHGCSLIKLKNIRLKELSEAVSKSTKNVKMKSFTGSFQ